MLLRGVSGSTCCCARSTFPPSSRAVSSTYQHLLCARRTGFIAVDVMLPVFNLSTFSRFASRAMPSGMYILLPFCAPARSICACKNVSLPFTVCQHMLHVSFPSARTGLVPSFCWRYIRAASSMLARTQTCVFHHRLLIVCIAPWHGHCLAGCSHTTRVDRFLTSCPRMIVGSVHVCQPLTSTLWPK